MDNSSIKISKFLSLVLRHRPELIGVQLDCAGWVPIETLLEACARSGHAISLETLRRVVRHNDKQRFAISENGLKIRANQGHSIKVNLDYEPIEPPEFLFHGTARSSLESIQRHGLVKRKRHHVHLSADTQTALKVGRRHGSPVVLTVKANLMWQKGFTFYRSNNNVWLTERAPAEFIVFPDSLVGCKV